MITYKTPGVYIEETPDRVRPIAGVSTSVAAFIGEATTGPLDAAMLVQSDAEFEAHYGAPLANSYLANAVELFFNNGGTHVYIARVSPDAADPLEARYQAAFGLLDAHDDISLLATPGMGTPSMLRFAAAYCEQRRDCFYIGEMAQTDDSVATAKRFLTEAGCDSAYAAIYFPWLICNVEKRSVKVPPSGAIAGMYARTDRYRGVWKAPAGTDADLHKVIGVSVNLDSAQHDLLNPLGINVIRDISDRGIVVMGARTLAARIVSEWKYVPVRRTAIYIEQSIVKGTQWAVFEPNGNALWTRLEQTIYAFMYGLYRLGAFMGQKPEHAFFVKCNAQTNTPYDAGVVRILVGFAPLKPAEFIVLQIAIRLGV